MAAEIDKLFKGYSVKEIEEILIKASLEAFKDKKTQYIPVGTSSRRSAKRVWVL